MPKAKPMSRSRNQLATAYAPESFFTFEGGIGGCISRSSPGESAALELTTREQIFERIHESALAWYESAVHVRDGQPGKPPVLPVQCVDRKFLDPTRTQFQI